MSHHKPLWYDLDHNVIPMEEAEAILSSPDRQIAVKEFDDGWTVSTVFLVLDHNWMSEGPPLLYETMVFTPSGEGIAQQRYPTKEEALEGHEEMVRRVPELPKEK